MTINTQRLQEVQERLEKLLTDKKSLNSKVTADAYTHFKQTVAEKGKSRNAAEVKSALRKLEQSLKNEGSYKNVKVGFEGAKNDILEIFEDPEFQKEKAKATTKAPRSTVPTQTHRHPGPRQTNPRAVTVTLSNAYARQNARARAQPTNIQRPIIEPDAPPVVRTRRPPIIEGRRASLATSSPEELATLNQTITRLFTHLDIDKAIPEKGVVKPQGRRGQRGRVHRSPSPHRGYHRNEAEVKELTEKLKKFEDAFQRKREIENEEVLSLQAQISKLKSQLSDLNRELERHRGIHSIANKAKGKLIEEKYQEEKKGMELRIHELEEGIKRNFYRNATEQDMSLRADIMKLKNEIQRLKQITESSSNDGQTDRPKFRNQASDYDINAMIHILDKVAGEMKTLKEINRNLESKSDSVNIWKQRFLDIEVDLDKFYKEVSTAHAQGSNDAQSPRESRKSASSPKEKLQKAKILLQSRAQKLEEAERALQEKSKLYDDARMELEKLREAVDGAFTEMSDEDASKDAQTKEKINASLKHSRLSDLDKIKFIRNKINRYSGSMKNSDHYTKTLEKDLECLHNRILRFDTGITSGLTDDNVHGDTPTPRDAHLYSLPREERSGLSETCQSTLKKIDVLQIGFLQIKEQNRDYVKVSNTLKKTSDAMIRVREELTMLCRALGMRPTTAKDGDPIYADVVEDTRLCRVAVERKDKEVQSKEGIIQKTYGDLERLKTAVHQLSEFSNSLQKRLPDKEPVDVTKTLTPLEEVDVVRKVLSRMHREHSSVQRSLSQKEQALLEKEKETTELVEKLQKDAVTREKEIEELGEDVKKIREEMSQNEKHFDKERKALQEKHRQEYHALEAAKEDVHMMLRKAERQTEEAKEENGHLSQENDDLKTRLSALAASNLQDGNSAITNLGDPNRPTKIAEYFTELYDNEWTNALETLTTSFHMEEKSAIVCLLDITKECYEFCTSLAVGQLHDLHKVLFMLYKDDSSSNSTLKEKIHELTKQETKSVRDIRRSIAPRAQSSVFKILHDDDGRTSVTNERLRSCGPYIERCVELCWLMQVQDPPLHLHWAVQGGSKVDQTTFKFYTQSGSFIEYLVWPSLHLFKDGHLLAKGVVQAF